ncbi:MAG: GNAT family N-acetyltransferase [Faecousia sp.]
MKQICELNDKIILGKDGLSGKAPRLTARAIVKNQDGLYAVMYADKFKLHSLPGGGVEDGEDVLTALRREAYEETGCVCDVVQELGIVAENRASLDYTQINYYFVVTTTHTPGENHLTEAEQDSRTVVEWHTFDEMVRLINEQEFDRVQGKYLKARDVAALQEYSKWVELYIPKLEDLWFYQKMMSDPETMSYNDPWGGCIDYPDEVLPDWYARWVGQEPVRFYAYTKRISDGAWIGDVCFYYTPDKDWYDMGIVIYAPYRGKGYSYPALKLLLDHAFLDCGISRIHNDFEDTRSAALHIHKKAGFREVGVEDGILQLMITKEEWERNRV